MSRGGDPSLVILLYVVYACTVARGAQGIQSAESKKYAPWSLSKGGEGVGVRHGATSDHNIIIRGLH